MTTLSIPNVLFTCKLQININIISIIIIIIIMLLSDLPQDVLALIVMRLIQDYLTTVVVLEELEGVYRGVHEDFPLALGFVDYDQVVILGDPPFFEQNQDNVAFDKWRSAMPPQSGWLRLFRLSKAFELRLRRQNVKGVIKQRQNGIEAYESGLRLRGRTLTRLTKISCVPVMWLHRALFFPRPGFPKENLMNDGPFESVKLWKSWACRETLETVVLKSGIGAEGLFSEKPRPIEAGFLGPRPLAMQFLFEKHRELLLEGLRLNPNSELDVCELMLIHGRLIRPLDFLAHCVPTWRFRSALGSRIYQQLQRKDPKVIFMGGSLLPADIASALANGGVGPIVIE